MFLLENSNLETGTNMEMVSGVTNKRKGRITKNSVIKEKLCTFKSIIMLRNNPKKRRNNNTGSVDKTKLLLIVSKKIPKTKEIAKNKNLFLIFTTPYLVSTHYLEPPFILTFFMTKHKFKTKNVKI